MRRLLARLLERHEARTASVRPHVLHRVLGEPTFMSLVQKEGADQLLYAHELLSVVAHREERSAASARNEGPRDADRGAPSHCSVGHTRRRRPSATHRQKVQGHIEAGHQVQVLEESERSAGRHGDLHAIINTCCVPNMKSCAKVYSFVIAGRDDRLHTRAQ